MAKQAETLFAVMANLLKVFVPGSGCVTPLSADHYSVLANSLRRTHSPRLGLPHTPLPPCTQPWVRGPWPPQCISCGTQVQTPRVLAFSVGKPHSPGAPPLTFSLLTLHLPHNKILLLLQTSGCLLRAAVFSKQPDRKKNKNKGDISLFFSLTKLA